MTDRLPSFDCDRRGCGHPVTDHSGPPTDEGCARCDCPIPIPPRDTVLSVLEEPGIRLPQLDRPVGDLRLKYPRAAITVRAETPSAEEELWTVALDEDSDEFGFPTVALQLEATRPTMSEAAEEVARLYGEYRRPEWMQSGEEESEAQ